MNSSNAAGTRPPGEREVPGDREFGLDNRRASLRGRDVVVVLTRAPSAAGKTRLFEELGCAPDPELRAALLLDTLDAVRAPAVTRAVCFTPSDAAVEMHALVPSDVVLLPQRGEDLGERMAHAFDDLLAGGASSVVLVGSDVPAIEASAVAEAHAALKAHPRAVVLGPADDGGYYLVGATATPTPLFTAMSWSSARVLEETEGRARELGIEIRHVAAARDIDSGDDLRALIRSASRAVRTREYCRRRGMLNG